MIYIYVYDQIRYRACTCRDINFSQKWYVLQSLESHSVQEEYSHRFNYELTKHLRNGFFAHQNVCAYIYSVYIDTVFSNVR